jgi:hypothetical protein
MTIPSLKEPTDNEKRLIPKLREIFLNEANKELELYYSEDIEKVITNDWSVHRFLLSSKGDINDGLNRMKNAFKWRKMFGVREIKETDFPQEYYRMLKYGMARDGSQLLIGQTKYHLPLSEWKDILKKLIIFIVEYLDNKNDGKGVTLLIDVSDAGYSNVDFDLALFLRPIHGKYYPQLVKIHLLTEIPWVISNILWIMLSVLPEKIRKIIKIVKKEELIEYIAEDQLPDSLGGKENKLISLLPKDAPNAKEVAQRLGISKKSLDKFILHFESIT